jgi:hypothetical protein
MTILPADIQNKQTLGTWLGALSDERRTIGGARFDALLIWGAPLIALLFVYAWLGIAVAFPKPLAERMATILASATAIITYAHLIAVVPRAYGNREVFTSNRFRLTLVPLLLLAALLTSQTLFVIALVLVVFWDVHHTAMQNFGLSRIYDMKAGNDPNMLRRADLRLNWILYVGPLIAGASLASHLNSLERLGTIDLVALAQLPGVLEGHSSILTMTAVAACAIIVGWSIRDYRAAMARGYRLSPHKLVLMLSTVFVSVIAWGLSSPLVAFVAVNLYHAAQYFGLVWLREGKRMSAFTGQRSRPALDLFLGGSLLFGIAYYFVMGTDIRFLGAPFVACSLLHFWFDGFVWSVRKKQI